MTLKRALLVAAAALELHRHHLEYKATHRSNLLEEAIYMEQLEIFVQLVKEQSICKLQDTLHVLK